ncbi:hypothetical protein HNR62_000299 [Oceanisphaera litoralis]|uniref:hypothetical protein n=1 Tax=Oceanisphaera litoralis TaxID=225144 RepID=UPI00195D556D|nr:hypothetical protein [Oceanisphaera litoralis]MBM7454470.1 hypothetical protein [Oceanisphaera litoralis]
MSIPFSPREHSTVMLSVDDVAINTPIAAASTVWIDNRGSSDLLIEFFSNPLDVDSYRVPPYAAQPISRPPSAANLYLKRPDGSIAGTVFVSQGYGV